MGGGGWGLCGGRLFRPQTGLFPLVSTTKPGLLHPFPYCDDTFEFHASGRRLQGHWVRDDDFPSFLIFQGTAELLSKPVARFGNIIEIMQMLVRHQRVTDALSAPAQHRSDVKLFEARKPCAGRGGGWGLSPAPAAAPGPTGTRAEHRILLR